MTSRDTRKCCEAVRSAILATAWLLVDILFTILNNIMYHFIIVSCDIFLFFFQSHKVVYMEKASAHDLDGIS